MNNNYPWGVVLFQSLTVSHPVKKLHTFYGYQSFITVFTKTAPPLVPNPSPKSQSTLSILLRSVLLSFSHLRMDLQAASFSYVFQPKPCVRLPTPTYTPHSPTSHSSSYDRPNNVL
jgi:hypothetical protein